MYSGTLIREIQPVVLKKNSLNLEKTNAIRNFGTFGLNGFHCKEHFSQIVYRITLRIILLACTEMPIEILMKKRQLVLSEKFELEFSEKSKTFQLMEFPVYQLSNEKEKYSRFVFALTS